jgi:hypothetical protein
LSADAPRKPEIVKLDKSHATEAFDCGSAPLNVYLQRYALINRVPAARKPTLPCSIVNRLPNLTHDRRPILTLLSDEFERGLVSGRLGF